MYTRILLPALACLTAALLSAGCGSKPKFEVGDFVMPTEEGEHKDILKIVGVGESEYKVFTHYLSDGKLMQTESYVARNRKEHEKTHLKIKPPHVEGSFSPERFLSLDVEPAKTPAK